MDLIQFFTLLIAIIGISWRFRVEAREDWKTAREDWKRSDEQIKAFNEKFYKMIESFNEEHKEFHRKLYEIEERRLKDK